MPSWSVPIIALCSPLLFITLYSRIWRASRLEVHNAILGGLSCVIFTALVTNLIKLAVRPLSWQYYRGHNHPNRWTEHCWTEHHVHDTSCGRCIILDVSIQRIHGWGCGLMPICCRLADPGQILWRCAGLRAMSLGMPIQGWPFAAKMPKMLQRAARASPVVCHYFSASPHLSLHLCKGLIELMGCLLLNVAVSETMIQKG